MDEIVIVVETCQETGQLIASWDDPSGNGGLTTQTRDLKELQVQVDDAVHCHHFDDHEMPKTIRFHFVTDPVLVTA